MSDQVPPPANQPPLWVWPPWFRVYLILLGITVAIGITQIAIPAGRGNQAGLDKTLSLVPVSLALDVLGAIGIALAVSRPFWRGETGYHMLIGIALFLLGSAAVGIFVFFGCMAVSRVTIP
jgi:hypothetical protein